MTTLENRMRPRRTRANAGDELGLLVNLLRQEKIGYRMLLRNVVEIVEDDYELVVAAVLLLTDRNKIKDATITQAEFADALVEIRCADEFRGQDAIIAAVSDAMQLDW